MIGKLQHSTEFPIRPKVLVAMVYFFLFRAWSIWMLTTIRFPDSSDAAPFRLLDTQQFLGLTAINIAFGVIFVWGGLEARNSHPNVRKGHYASALIGLDLDALDS